MKKQVYYIDKNEFGFDQEKLTLIEDLLNWVKDGLCRVRYKPTGEKKYITLFVNKYNLENISDRINKDIGFFLDETGKQICIASWQIKWFELYT